MKLQQAKVHLTELNSSKGDVSNFDSKKLIDELTEQNERLILDKQRIEKLK